MTSITELGITVLMYKYSAKKKKKRVMLASAVK